MELKEGMYVRYTRSAINGYVPPKIAKIVNCSNKELVSLDNWQVILRNDVIKASYNIIDLIEVEDYVNGKEVTEIMKDEEGNVTDVLFTEEVESQSYSLLPIKNIVTKEQFNSVKYEVEQ